MQNISVVVDSVGIQAIQHFTGHTGSKITWEELESIRDVVRSSKGVIQASNMSDTEKGGKVNGRVD